MKTVYSQKQRGVVLVIALIVLMALSLIGLITLQSSAVQERISSNMRQMSIAMQTADSALREAEAVIAAQDMSNLTTLYTTSCTNGLCTTGAAPDPFDSSTWTGSKSQQVTQSYLAPIVAPRYYIEYMGSYSLGSGSSVMSSSYGDTSAVGSSTANIFRVVARGTGGGKAQIIYQSYYQK